MPRRGHVLIEDLDADVTEDLTNERRVEDVLMEGT
jgi:hypothetical protein